MELNKIRSAYLLSPLIAAARKKKGLTQQELADQLGVNRKTVAQIESGKVDRVAAGTLLKAPAYVGLDLSVKERRQPNLVDIEQMGYERRYQSKP